MLVRLVLWVFKVTKRTTGSSRTTWCKRPKRRCWSSRPCRSNGPAGKDSPRGFLMVSIRQAFTIENPSFNVPLDKTSISIGENAQLTESREIEILKSGEYAISFIISHQVLLQNIHCVLEYIVTTRSAQGNSNEIARTGTTCKCKSIG